MIRMKLMIRVVFLLTALYSFESVLVANVIASAQSPDNEISVDFWLEGDALYYTVFKQDAVVVEKSKLAIKTSIGDFSSVLNFESANSSSVDASYFLPSGKKSLYINKYHQTNLVFTKDGETLEVVFRVYNDGVAFRYNIHGSGEMAVTEESSECVFSEVKRIFLHPTSKISNQPFEERSLDLLSCMNSSLALPLLVETNNSFVLLTEAMVDGNYAGAGMTIDELSGAFVFNVKQQEAVSLPFDSPWRTLIIGDLETIVASSLVDNLNKATSVTDFSWIKPGRAAWSYGGEDTSGYLDLENIKKYIDWAHQMGWEYFTLDKGWQNSGFTLSQVVTYANAKSIGVFVWVNQNSLPDDEVQLRNYLANLKNQGVKGLKVDYWDNESQRLMKKYNALLKLTAEQRLLVNMSSGPKPTGLRRTWPQLLTSEAVFGNIYYAQNSGVHCSADNINSAIIRNALGATDYAPVDFAKKDGRILQSTTWAHQLALSIIFESGVQHIMDAPENLQYHISKSFLSTLPSKWDDTKCLAAEPDQYISMVRKSSADWYLSALTHEAKNLEVSLAFLSPGTIYNAYVYKDGDCPSEIAFEYIENLNSDDQLTLTLLSSGGTVIRFSPADDHEKPVFVKYEAESDDNFIPFGVPVKDDPDGLCSGGKYVSSIGNGRSLTFQNVRVPETGLYALTSYYMADSERWAFWQINDDIQTLQEQFYINTGKESGDGLAHKTILVELEASVDNVIEYGHPTEQAPSIDRISLLLIQDDGLSADRNPTKESEVDVSIYTDRKAIIIEHSNTADYSIFNTAGQLIGSGNFTGKATVPVFTSGVYIVNVYADSVQHTEKVMIN